MDVLARVQFSKAWLGALFHDFCLMIFVSLFIFHDISSYPMRFFWSLKLSYKNWDLGFLSWFLSQVRWELFSAHVLMRRGDLRRNDEVVVKSWWSRWVFERLFEPPGAASLGISGCDGDGSDGRLRSFLLAPKCPLERELATRFLGRSWALEVIVVVVGVRWVFLLGSSEMKFLLDMTSCSNYSYPSFFL